MQFPQPLMSGTLVRRYKRFLADVDINGKVETVHCPNPGAMTGLDAPGSRVFLSRSANLKRKLPLTLEIVEADGTLVGVNTNHPNRLAETAIAAQLIEEFAGYDTMRREIRYGENSRIDILLQKQDHPDCYVEVKNVHLSRKRGLMEFPDCPTARGAKHLRELAREVAEGNRAVMLFVVQRADGSRFKLARDIDPAYAAAFDQARAAGVEMLAWSCRVAEDEIVLESPLIIDE